MKLIFLHGLGQSADSWKEVQDLLADYPSEAIELFPTGVWDLSRSQRAHLSALIRGDRTFCLNRFVFRGCTSVGAFQVLRYQIFRPWFCQDVH